MFFFLEILRYVYVGVCSVAQSYPTLCGPIACHLPGSSAHGIFQVRILELVAIFFFFFFNFILFFKLYIIVLVLPNIKMNPPQVYMCSPS